MSGFGEFVVVVVVVVCVDVGSVETLKETSSTVTEVVDCPEIKKTPINVHINELNKTCLCF